MPSGPMVWQDDLPSSMKSTEVSARFWTPLGTSCVLRAEHEEDDRERPRR